MAIDSRRDSELVAALNKGEEFAFDAIYYRYRDWVVRLARRMTGNNEDALDVLQETFLYLAGKFPGFRLSSSMASFLYPVVKNLSIEIRRKSQRYRIGGQVPETASPAEPSASELEMVIAGLPEGQREVVLMRFVDDLSLAEIADALAIPLGTVKSRLHGAIETLRNDPRARRYFDRE